MPLPRLILAAAAAALLLAPATASAQSIDPNGPQPWNDEAGDWRRRAAAEKEAMQAVAELFSPTRTPAAAPATETPDDSSPALPEREPAPGDPSLFFE